MQDYDWHPIVLVRDLPDVIVSLRDHMLNEGPLWSMVWLDERFSERSDSEQLDLLVDLAAPWFIQFFVSWSEASRLGGGVRPLWVQYADWVGAPETTLTEVARSVGLNPGRSQVASALESARGRQTRLNVGRPGRGSELLSDAQLGRLNGFARHYPHLDFTTIGLSLSLIHI